MEFQLSVEILIIAVIFIQVNTFLVYPVIISILTNILDKPVDIDPRHEPDVTVLLAAYNEERLVEDAVRSIFSTNYPQDKIHVYAGSDGSSDGTIEILQKLQKEYKNLRIFDFPRSGKNRVLNMMAKEVNTELIFFLDADCRLQDDSLKRLVIKFADDEVGAAMAAVKIISNSDKDNAGSLGEGLYQKYETFLRIRESKIFSSINSLGTLYGVRADIFRPIPNDKVCDDLYNLLVTSLAKKRIIFDDQAVIHEVREKSISLEINRRIRMVAGGLATVWATIELLNPKYGWASIFVWFHKVLRWMSPIFLILMFVGMLLLPMTSFLKMPLMILFGILIVGFGISYVLEKFDVPINPLRLILFYVSMNYAFLIGIFRFIKGAQNSMWSEKGLSKV